VVRYDFGLGQYTCVGALWFRFGAIQNELGALLTQFVNDLLWLGYELGRSEIGYL